MTLVANHKQLGSVAKIVEDVVVYSGSAKNNRCSSHRSSRVRGSVFYHGWGVCHYGDHYNA